VSYVVRKNLIDQYKQLHKENKEYGKSSDTKFRIVSYLVKQGGKKSLLDYGCGKSVLMDSLYTNLPDIEVVKYDPAIEQFSQKPTQKFDLVVCTDVMEHIPEEDVSDVLRDIFDYSESAFFVISTRPANAVLPDGQNAHATVKTPFWWQDKINDVFGKADILHYCKEKEIAYFIPESV
jgi:hypothetical protein